MSAPIPNGWQWTTTITGREQLEHVASKFSFTVPLTDEYARAMAAVVERYRQNESDRWRREANDPANPRNIVSKMIKLCRDERREPTEEEWTTMRRLLNIRDEDA